MGSGNNVDVENEFISEIYILVWNGELILLNFDCRLKWPHGYHCDYWETTLIISRYNMKKGSDF